MQRVYSPNFFAGITINRERAVLYTLLACCGYFVVFRTDVLLKWAARARLSGKEKGQRRATDPNSESYPLQKQKAPQETQDSSENNSHNSIYPPQAEYPLQVLHEEDDAIVEYANTFVLPSFSNKSHSIVAVHGLGANPDYAWTWLPKNNPPGKTGYPTSRVNWLQDLLPACLSANNISSRIMTFNYNSTWFMDAPQQRLSNISDTLLDSLGKKRASVSHHLSL